MYAVHRARDAQKLCGLPSHFVEMFRVDCGGREISMSVVFESSCKVLEGDVVQLTLI